MRQALDGMAHFLDDRFQIVANDFDGNRLGLVPVVGNTMVVPELGQLFVAANLWHVIHARIAAFPCLS